jgi:hypothetical protein
MRPVVTELVLLLIEATRVSKYSSVFWLYFLVFFFVPLLHFKKNLAHAFKSKKTLVPFFVPLPSPTSRLIHLVLGILELCPIINFFIVWFELVIRTRYLTVQIMNDSASLDKMRHYSEFRYIAASQELVDNIYDLLGMFHQVMEECRVKYEITGGTLLGAYRCGGFMAWDDDADVIVFLSHDEFMKLASVFALRGLRLERTQYAKFSRIKFIQNGKKGAIDIFHVVLCGDHYDWDDWMFHYQTGPLQKSSKAASNLKLMNFGHLDLYAANDVVFELKKMYGERFNSTVIFTHVHVSGPVEQFYNPQPERFRCKKPDVMFHSKKK